MEGVAAQMENQNAATVLGWMVSIAAIGVSIGASIGGESEREENLLM